MLIGQDDLVALLRRGKAGEPPAGHSPSEASWDDAPFR